MKVSFFIDRPVFSAVISILIVIVGIIGLTMLPIDQYPQITPPVVKISASYPGASALTVSQAVATPIEQELNGTPGMLYMESNSSNSGGFSATVTFDISADPDPGGSRNTEPYQVSRITSSSRSYTKWYFGRETGCQSIADLMPYLYRPEVR